jgi:hypothetical protein
MPHNRISKGAGIVFWVLLSISVLYIFIKDNRKYAEFVELIGLSIGAIFVILFFIGFIAIILTLFRPFDYLKNKLNIEGEKK